MLISLVGVVGRDGGRKRRLQVGARKGHPIGSFFRVSHMPIEEKKMANRPSTTITRKIDFTTEVVVCRPSDSALPWTRRPSAQATTPIISAMNGALIMPTSK